MRPRFPAMLFIIPVLACAWPAAAAAGGFSTLIIDYPSISPNGDGVKDSSAVRVTVTEPCETIAVTIEETGTAVDTLLLRLDAPPGTYQSVWKGVDSLDLLLPEGAYTLHLVAVSADTTEEDTRTVIVDVTPPLVAIDRIDPGIFTPGIAGAAEKVLIYFLITDYEEGSALTITVTDPGGTPDTVSPGEITGDGLYVVEWPADGTPADGMHTVALAMEDVAGNSSDDAGVIDVDADGPIQGFITEIAAATREAPSVLEGYCYDRNGVESPMISWNEGEPVPPHATAVVDDTLFWQFDIEDSVTAGGQYIEGEYSCAVTCADLFGHETDISLTFEIDRTPPGPPAIVEPFSPVSEPAIALEMSYNAAEIDSFIVYRTHGGTTETKRTDAALFVNLTLEEGENSIRVEGLDRAGNASAPSNTVTVVYETTAGIFYPEVFRGPDIFRAITGVEARTVTVDIFTVSGELVVELEQRGPGDTFQLAWDLTNGDGEEVRNGTYVVVITIAYNDTKRVEKNFIAVVR